MKQPKLPSREEMATMTDKQRGEKIEELLHYLDKERPESLEDAVIIIENAGNPVWAEHKRRQLNDQSKEAE